MIGMGANRATIASQCLTRQGRRAEHRSKTRNKLWGLLLVLAPFLFLDDASRTAKDDSKFDSATSGRYPSPFRGVLGLPKVFLASADTSLGTSSNAHETASRGLIEIEEDCNIVDQVNGGMDVPKGEFRYFTAILDRIGGFLCSGVLIGRRYVLTAGHCGELERDTILFADVGYRCSNSVNCGDLHERIAVQDVHYVIGDLALITLVSDAPNGIPNATPDIGGKYLKKAKKVKKKGGKVVLVGGGRSGEGGGISATIQMISLELVRRKKCIKKHFAHRPELVAEGFICSLPFCRNENNSTSGACRGDSGGPIMYIDSKGQDTAQVVAVHSFGRRFCDNVRTQPDGHFTVVGASEMISRVVCNGDFPAEWCGKSLLGDEPFTPDPTPPPSLMPTPVLTDPPPTRSPLTPSQDPTFFPTTRLPDPTLSPSTRSLDPTPSPSTRTVTSLQSQYMWTFSGFLGGRAGYVEGRTNAITSLSFRPTNNGSYILVAAYDRALPQEPPDNGETIKIFNVETRRTILSLSGHAHGTKIVEFHPTRPLLVSASASGSPNEVKVWDADSGNLLYTFQGGTLDSVTSDSNGRVQWLFDGNRLAYYAGQGEIKVWNMAQGETQTLFVDGNVEPRGFRFAFHKDGDRLILAGGAVIKVVYFDPLTLTVQNVVLLHRFETPHDFPYHLAYSPDYTMFAIAMQSQAAYVFDSVTFQLLHTFSLQSIARSVAWHPSGKYLAVGSSAEAAGDVYVYKIGADDDNMLLLIQHGSAGHRRSLQWSLDGKYLAHASGFGSVRIDQMFVPPE